MSDPFSSNDDFTGSFRNDVYPEVDNDLSWLSSLEADYSPRELDATLVRSSLTAGEVGARQRREVAKLVRLAQNGDGEAFSKLVEIYKIRVSRKVKWFISDPTIAEDIIQDAFVEAWDGIHTLRRTCLFATWLTRIATNLCLDHLKIRYRPRGQTTSLDEIADAASIVDPKLPTPHEALERSELNERILDAVDHLPAFQREVFIRSAFDGYNYDQIAHALGVPKESVRSCLHRARLALRDHLRSYLEGN